jgi:hypothetical protein
LRNEHLNSKEIDRYYWDVLPISWQVSLDSLRTIRAARL